MIATEDVKPASEKEKRLGGGGPGWASRRRGGRLTESGRRQGRAAERGKSQAGELGYETYLLVLTILWRSQILWISRLGERLQSDGPASCSHH